MEQCLLQKRLPLKAASSEDLALMWQVYIRKDNHLRALRREMEGLCAKQEAEIHTIVEYVESLERKKEMLLNKLDAEKIMQEDQRNEIEEMLLQKNLAEIISCSPSEQVAYLLAERSSLLEKLHGLDGINVKEGRQSGEENASKERDQQQLERDAAEAASTLDEAHQEIRQLRDELESFCLTLGACSGHLYRELEAAEQEEENLKCHDMPQLRKGTDANKPLKAEISQLRDTVHRMKRCFYTPKGSLSTVKRRKKAKDIHKRCSEELKEKICALQDLKQDILQLYCELEKETMQRKKAEEECEKQRESREEAEELTMQLQELQEQKDSDYEAQVQYFQEQINLLETIDELGVQIAERKDRECMQHLQLLQSLKTELDWVKSALQTPAPAPHHEEPKIQSQEVQLLNKEQQSTRDLLGNSREQLLILIERNSQFQHRIGFLEQENQKVVAELAESLANVKQLEENEASMNKRMKHLEERDEELQSLLAKEELSQQVFDLQNKEMIKLRQVIENLNERLTISEQDYKRLHPQLQQADLNLSLQIRKYNNRKALHKQKNGKAKELYLRETGWRDEKIQEQEKQLGILTNRLERVVAELAESLAKVKQLEENEASMNKRMKHLEEREEELQSLLAKEELSQQVYDLQNKEMIKLRQVIENLNERLTISEQDYKKLHPQLQQADLNLSLQIRKYNDKKALHRQKIGKAKKLYLRETGWRDEKIQEQEKQLGILTNRLERMQAENEALLLNKQELLHQLNKAEEARLHPVATVTSMQQRLDLPETDNVQKRGANILKSTKIKNLLKKLRNS